MFWLVAILASILCALLLFIAVGLSSKRQPDVLMGRSQSEMVKAQIVEVEKADDQTKAESVFQPPIEPLSPASTVHPQQYEPEPLVTGAFATEADLDEAELMLREVKAMLLQGRPDRAIAHIRSVTGVEEHLACEFVEEVQQQMVG